MVGHSEITVDGTLTVNGNVNMTGNSSVCGTGIATYSGTLTTSGSANWCSSLPIELATFSGQWSEEGVILYWATASETNNDFFTVERCIDGHSFEAITELDGAGTSSNYKGYEYLDNSDLSSYEWVYYRIKQTDFDGKASYSNVVAVEPKGSKGLKNVLLYPNPANELVNVEFVSDAREGDVMIYNDLGQLVAAQHFFGEAGRQALTFDAKKLDEGTYTVVIFVGTYQLQQRLAISK